MTEKEIHSLEENRKEIKDFRVIHFFIVSNYVRAFDVSAWLAVTILGNQNNYPAFKNIKVVHSYKEENPEDKTLFIGFPSKSQHDYIPNVLKPEYIDERHFVLRLEDKLFNGYTPEQVISEYLEWKETIPSTPFKSKNARTSQDGNYSQPGLIHKILSYQTHKHSLEDHAKFIESLKEDALRVIANIF